MSLVRTFSIGCGNIGLSLGTEERMKTPFFTHESEEGTWHLMRVRRTIHTRTARRRVRE
jgi:hypothetical protein